MGEPDKKKHIFAQTGSKFCTDKVCRCETKNNYQSCCDAVKEAWKIEQGEHGKRFGMEAHHILCVESVNQRPTGKNAERLQQILDQTGWCINAKLNMVALPKFGHTLKWYTVRGIRNPPSWKNLPQHDIHHNNKGGYRHEVSQDIRELWSKLTRQIDEKNCELKPETIASMLNDLSMKWDKALKKRGNREDGTHTAWNRAKSDNGYAGWILPFSMASDAVALALSVGLTFDDRHTRKFKQLITAMSKGPAT